MLLRKGGREEERPFVRHFFSGSHFFAAGEKEEGQKRKTEGDGRDILISAAKKGGKEEEGDFSPFPSFLPAQVRSPPETKSESAISGPGCCWGGERGKIDPHLLFSASRRVGPRVKKKTRSKGQKGPSPFAAMSPSFDTGASQGTSAEKGQRRRQIRRCLARTALLLLSFQGRGYIK